MLFQILKIYPRFSSNFVRFFKSSSPWNNFSDLDSPILLLLFKNNVLKDGIKILIGNISSKFVEKLKIYLRHKTNLVRFYNSLIPKAKFSNPVSPILILLFENDV